MIEQRGVDKYTAGKTYYVDVKKCKRCRHPIEKNGGCQHMVCRCGFSFCWECLQGWDAHMPALKCPTSHVKMETMGLDDFVDVLSREYYYSKAVDHRKQKQTKFNRLKGRLITAVKNQQRAARKGESCQTEFQSFYGDVAQQSEQYSRDMERLRRMAAYVYQLHHLLEFGNVFLSQTKSRKHKNLDKDLTTLALFATSLSQLLYEEKIQCMVDLVQKYHSIQSHTDRMIRNIVPRMIAGHKKTVEK